MEIIKFRAKPTTAVPEDVIEDMGEDFKDGFVYGQINYDDNGEPWIFSKISESNEDFVLPHWWTPVIPETIGQYVGISDMSQEPQDIYKGDIVEIAFLHPRNPDYVLFRMNSVIELENGVFGIRWLGQLKSFGQLEPGIKFIKIGNITDNPELMKGNESCQ